MPERIWPPSPCTRCSTLLNHEQKPEAQRVTVRAHDLAQIIGVDSRLPDDLVQGLWAQVSPHAEEWRAIGVFGPKVDVPDNADLHAKLLGLTGRQP